jgi:thiamine biosynthesis lipoprotein
LTVNPISRCFRVMASATQVTTIGGPPEASRDAERRLRALEGAWSRFIDTSDITHINSHPDTWIQVEPDTIRLIDTMCLASTATGGSYDPTHLHQLLSLGYTASIDDPDRFTIAVERPSEGLEVHDIEIDRSASAVRTPAGLSLDPGGIGKGLAADLVVIELLDQGVDGALVCIGGDIAAAGAAPTELGWPIAVDDPHRPGNPITTLAVSGGGVATSSTQSRRWFDHGREHHHVIDPTTRSDSDTDLAAVTVVANAGWMAEAHATAAILRGTAGAVDYLEDRELAGVAIAADGTVTSTIGPVTDHRVLDGVAR